MHANNQTKTEVVPPVQETATPADRRDLASRISVRERDAEWVVLLCPFEFGEPLRTHLAGAGIQLSSGQQAFSTQDGRENVEIEARTNMKRAQEEVASFAARSGQLPTAVSPSLPR